MPRLRMLRRRSRRLQRLACFLHLWVGCALLMSGCSQNNPPEFAQSFGESEQKLQETIDAWALAPDAVELPVAEQKTVVAAEKTRSARPSQFWQFSDDTRLVCLPAIEDSATPADEFAVDEIAVETQPLGVLLPPRVCEDQAPGTGSSRKHVSAYGSPVSDNGSPANAYGSPDDVPTFDVEMPETVVEEIAVKRGRAIEGPKFTELSAEERHLLNVIERETLAATTGVLTDAQLEEECRAKIASAFALAERGASYVARQELIEVLRKISQAKDSREESRTRTESLAAGLRALEEAEDFAPRGTQLEAELALKVVCASHRTPLGKELDLTKMLPSQMMDRYNRYAQIKLAVAVAGEPAGSMALYTLGKLNSQLNATEPEQHPLAIRRAVAFQQAALLAHNENYMAAHELGVLLAETGHYPEARHLLAQVAVENPNAVVYRNLARVQEKLGQPSEAQLCRSEAQRLQQQGRGPRSAVAWVSPQEFSRNQMNTFTPQVASRPAPTTQSAPVWR